MILDFLAARYRIRIFRGSATGESAERRGHSHYKTMNSPFLRPLLGKFWCNYFFCCAAGACSLDGGTMFLIRM